MIRLLLFLGVYNPTSPLMVHHILEIATHMKAYKSDLQLCDVVVAMKSKYLKYWKEIPMLYAFVFILIIWLNLQCLVMYN